MRPPKLYNVGGYLISIKEAAELLEIKEDTLRKKMRRGAKLNEVFVKAGIVVSIDTAPCE